MEQANVIFHLTHGLDDQSMSEAVNSRRYGDRTWFEEKSYQFSVFSFEQSNAIKTYLEFKRDMHDTMDFEVHKINQAIKNFWDEKTGL